MEMPDHLPEIPEPQDPRGALHEHLELSHYIDTFRMSAERVRRLVFIIAVFSVVMFTALWNTTNPSAINTRLSGYRNLSEQSDAEIAKRTKNKIRTKREMQELLSEYSKLRLERELFPHIPILGITFDVNDLGLFCGMAYVLLLLLLLFSLMREHEHLHLALFKVRRLYDGLRNRNERGGESRANYLYHALAMSQVLNSPPTLALWKPSRFKRVTLSLIFFLPVAMELFIVVVDWSTLKEVSKNLDIKASIIYLEWFFIVFNSILCFTCFRYSGEFNRMWTTAFYHINPTYKKVKPTVLLNPLQWRRDTERSHTQKRLRAQAISNLEVDMQWDTKILLSNHLLIAGDAISNTEADEMCRQLEMQAESQGTIVEANVTSSTLVGNRWEVQAEFSLRTSTLPLRRPVWRLMSFRRERVVMKSTAIILPVPGGAQEPDGSTSS